MSHDGFVTLPEPFYPSPDKSTVSPQKMNRPHFADIARDLTEGIASGHYPVGSYLRTELELRDHYQTSRHTVRAALHELQQLGFVSRRKNAGTRVESAQPRNDFRPSLASVDDLVQFGSEHLRLCAVDGGSRCNGRARQDPAMFQWDALATHFEPAYRRRQEKSAGRLDRRIYRS
jgi:DNA-binding transcriptional regulator YhcF (GntR family)